MRVHLLAVAVLLSAPASAEAQDGKWADICTAVQACDMQGMCSDTDLRFSFTQTEDAAGNLSDWVEFPGEQAVLVIPEASTQGFTFSTDTRVYTLLYLFNDSHNDGDLAEFALLDADINGRLSAATLYTGTCEARP
ncbi:MAG: hypothetical protein AAF376_07935 [Pseudomonadota bacterium]